MRSHTNKNLCVLHHLPRIAASASPTPVANAASVNHPSPHKGIHTGAGTNLTQSLPRLVVLPKCLQCHSPVVETRGEAKVIAGSHTKPDAQVLGARRHSGSGCRAGGACRHAQGAGALMRHQLC